MSEHYEKSANCLKVTSDPVERSKLLFALTDSKQEMERNLKTMTTITVKLNEKVLKEQGKKAGSGSAEKKNKNKGKHTFNIEQQEDMMMKD